MRLATRAKLTERILNSRDPMALPLETIARANKLSVGEIVALRCQVLREAGR